VPTWRRRFSTVNTWMEHNLDADRWLHGLGRHRRKVLLAASASSSPFTP